MKNTTPIAAPAFAPWPIVVEALGVLGVWFALFFLCGSPYPYDYDSVNYALAITDRFDLRLNQPHLPYVFHIFFCKLWSPAFHNPFILQRAVSMAYLLVVLWCLLSLRPRGSGLVFLAATCPLLLFFCCVPVIHPAALMIGALLAFSIDRLQKGKLSPVAVAAVFFIGVGFRPDLAMFLGPVVAVALWKRCSFRQMAVIVALGVIITLGWYLPAKLLSGGASPFEESSRMMRLFAATNSMLFGATPFQHARSALRFLIYGIGVLGPGGLLYCCLAIRKGPARDTVILLAAVLPLLLYGVVMYLPYPNYYAPALGFLIVWLLRAGGPEKASPRLMLSFALLNVLFFWFMPPPRFTDGRSAFSERTLAQNVAKQVSYLGANGREVALEPKRIFAFVDKHIAGTDCFTNKNAPVFDRMWQYMASRVWHCRYVPDAGPPCARVEYDFATKTVSLHRQPQHR